MSLTKASYSMVNGAPINVLDYGADSTGVSDSSTAFQAAINACGKAQILFIPKGAYKITQTLEIRNTIIVQGTGQRYTALNWSGGANPMFHVYSATVTDDSSFTLFKDFQIDNYQGTATHAIYLDGTLQFTMERIFMQPDTAFSTAILESNPASSIIRLTVRDCYFVSKPSSIGNTAISVHWAGQVLIDNTHFEDFNNCVYLGDYGVNTVQNVYFVNDSRTQNSSNASATAVGIYAADVQNLTISGSSLWSANNQNAASAGQIALYLKKVAGAQITGNEFWGGGQALNGIYVATSDVRGAEIIGNTFARIASAGIAIDSGATPLLYVRDNYSSNTSIPVIATYGTGTQTTIAASKKTANTYEEGIFTPIIEGSTSAGTGTYSVQSGNYTRIGRIIYFDLSIVWSAHTGTGNMRVSGLPFGAASGVFAPCGIAAENLTFSNQLTCYATGGANYLTVASFISAGAISNVAMDSAAQLLISGSYQIAV